MIHKYGVNQFKFDGTGNVDSVFPGSRFDSDFSAAIHLIGELRAAKPDIFINLTTGTWPSPFWLMYADSIWRGGDDDSHRRRRNLPRALDHLSRRADLSECRPARTALSAQLAHAPRHDLRQQHKEPRQGSRTTIFATRFAPTSAPARSFRRCTSRRPC